MMDLSHLFRLKMDKIISSNKLCSSQFVNEKMVDLYLDESVTGSLDISDKRRKQEKVIRILTVLYPISFKRMDKDQLENPKFLEYLRKSKNLSSDLKKDLKDIYNLMEGINIPKIYKELGFGVREYMKRLGHIRLRKILVKGLREFERANNEMSKDEKAEVRRVFHDLELLHLDPLIYIAEALGPRDIGFEALNLFLDSSNNIDHKKAIIGYKKTLMRDYLDHLEKYPTIPYNLENLDSFESRLLEKGKQ